MKLRVYTVMFLLAIMLGIAGSADLNGPRAYGHPVYTKQHVDYHMSRYQQLIGSQARTNRILRNRISSLTQGGVPYKWQTRSALASWYGPGLYGNTTANGTVLTRGTHGVAHKTLPLGTQCVLRKGNRIIRVRVIDRGPYEGVREFDLTGATASYLRFSGVGRIRVSCRGAW